MFKNYFKSALIFIQKILNQNLDYVIVSGARRQENRWDPFENEQIVPEDKDTSKRLFDDAMFKLEHGTEDIDKAKKAAPVLVKLHDAQDAKWNDDFAANSLLRQQLRVSYKPTLYYVKCNCYLPLNYKC